jgi:hypothetical protein
MYPKEPVSRSYQVIKFIAPAIPKSMILIFCSSELTNKIFSSFKSL